MTFVLIRRDSPKSASVEFRFSQPLDQMPCQRGLHWIIDVCLRFVAL